jgi:hypothetical protein
MDRRLPVAPGSQPRGNREFAFLEPDEIKGMDRQDAVEIEGLMRVTERMFAGEQRQKSHARSAPTARLRCLQRRRRARNVPVDRETADGRFYARMISPQRRRPLHQIDFHGQSKADLRQDHHQRRSVEA